jgi:hypothetical protein
MNTKIKQIIGNLLIKIADYLGAPKRWGGLPEDSLRFKILYTTYSVGCDLNQPSN